MISEVQTTSAGEEFLFAIREARTPPVRSMLEYAESELRIPDDGSRFAGRPFRAKRQPWTKLYLNELDDPRWRSIVIQGPTQSGKTYAGVILPLAYHVDELRENYVFGVPDVQMASTKWAVDIQPVFLACERLRRLLPNRGPGSKNGIVRDQVIFSTGQVLKFMTAGGSDESKAGFTSRTLGVTEIKRFTRGGEASVESSPLEQLRGRLLSFRRSERREYLEGTVSVEDEFPHALRPNSTESEIFTPCPECDQWSAIGRDNLLGWKGWDNEEEAAENAYFACPACDHKITDAERRDVNREAVLVHRGQSIENGKVIGDRPKTSRLFFRYSAYHNLFVDAAEFAVEEWKREQQQPNSEQWHLTERKLCQQIWSIPWEMPTAELNPLDEKRVAKRLGPKPRKTILDGHDSLVIGIDAGMYRCHFVALSFDTAGELGYHVADYGTLEVLKRGGDSTADERRLAVEVRLAQVLETFNELAAINWHNPDGSHIAPKLIVCDAGYLPDPIFESAGRFNEDVNRLSEWYPYFGKGVGSGAADQYVHPTRITQSVLYLGEQYTIRLHQQYYSTYISGNADHWKSKVHDELAIDEGEPGAITLFTDPGTQHKTFIRHLLSEKQVFSHHPKLGEIVVWELDESRSNHYLDALYMARLGAGHVQAEAAEPVDEQWGR